MPGFHAKLSPSASTRWLTCPGSLGLPQEPGEESAYAAEGTAAHELAEVCLRMGSPAEDFIGDEFYGHVVDQYMADNVQVYVDVCEQLLREHQGFSEVEAYLEHQTIENFGGTADFMLATEETIYLVDLKYGSGHVVEVDQNDQLLCYAVLAMNKHFNFHTNPNLSAVSLTIVQPRAAHEDGPVRNVVVSAEEVWEHEDRIQDQVLDNADHLEAGSHCRWCPAKVHCPELKDHVLKTAKTEFAEEGMTPEIAAELIQLKQPLVAYLDEVYKWLHGRMEKGESVSGMKLVDSYGNRRWSLSDAEVVEAIKKIKRISKDKMFNTKLKSPAQMEKILSKDALASLIERPARGTTVVPDYDKRPEVERKTAKEEFDTVD